MPNPAAHAVATEPRTLRAIVDDTPQLVNETWVRSVLAQLLHVIEADRADDMTHRIIMPDTVVVDQQGVATLLPSLDEELDSKPAVAVDLKALAAVLHYAITKEIPPRGPLASRALPGYSAALLGAIDRCLHGDRNTRPQNVDALRALLGIPTPPPPPAAVLAYSSGAPAGDGTERRITAVPLSAAGGERRIAAVPPATAHVPARPHLEVQPELPHVLSPSTASSVHVPTQRPTHWLMATAALCVLVTCGVGLYQLGRHVGANEQRALSLAPPFAQLADPAAAPPTSAAPVDATSAAAVPSPIVAPAALAATAPGSATTPVLAASPVPSSDAATHAASVADVPTAAGVAPAAATSPAMAPAAGTPAVANAAPGIAPSAPAIDAAPAPATIYKLQIKPWGTVYVDGVKRGVSPPLKGLKLSPGEHTIRIENPSFPTRVIVVNSGKTKWGKIEHDFH
jgi:hypothetical protein